MDKLTKASSSGALAQPAIARISLALSIWLLGVLSLNDLVTQALGRTWYSLLFGLQKDLILAILIVLAVVAGRGRVKKIGAPTLWLGVPLLVVYLACAQAYTRSTGLVSAAYGFRNSYWGLLLLPTTALLLSPASWGLLARCFIAASQACALISISTWLLGVRWLGYLVPRDSTGNFPATYFISGSLRPRAFSPYASPNTLGAVMAVSIIVTLVVVARQRPWVAMLLVAIPSVSLVLSESRSAAVGMVAGVTVYTVASVAAGGRNGIFRRPDLILAVFLLIGGVCLLGYRVMTAVTASPPPQASHASASSAPPVSPAPRPASGAPKVATPSPRPHVAASSAAANPLLEPSTEGHLKSLAKSGLLLVHNPLGVGLGNVGPRSLLYSMRPSNTESSFLLVGLELGVPGLLGYLGVLLGIVRVAGRCWRSSEFIGLISLLGVVLLTQAFLPSIQELTGTWPVWILFGALLAGRAQLVDIAPARYAPKT